MKIQPRGLQVILGLEAAIRIRGLIREMFPIITSAIEGLGLELISKDTETVVLCSRWTLCIDQKNKLSLHLVFTDVRNRLHHIFPSSDVGVVANWDIIAVWSFADSLGELIGVMFDFLPSGHALWYAHGLGLRDENEYY